MPDEFHYFNTFGYDRNKLNSRLRLFELGFEDKLSAEKLHELVIAPRHKLIINEFYEYLFSHKEFRGFFTSTDTLEKLKKNQTAYLNTLGKQFDHFSYFDLRLRIGVAHQRINMPLALYECASHKLRNIVIANIPPKTSDKLRNNLTNFLLKIISLDMSIAIDSYHRQEVSSLMQSINHLEKKQDKLIELTHLDSLTGIANRNYFIQHLTRDIEKLKDKDNLCLIMIDIDNLGKINDTLSHLAGDFIIKEITRRLTSIPQHTMLGRYGGDEFMMIAYDADMDATKQIMLQNRRLVEKTPITLGGKSIHIQISQGAIKIAPQESLGSIVQRVGKELTDHKLQKIAKQDSGQDL